MFQGLRINYNEYRETLVGNLQEDLLVDGKYARFAVPKAMAKSFVFPFTSFKQNFNSSYESYCNPNSYKICKILTGALVGLVTIIKCFVQPFFNPVVVFCNRDEFTVKKEYTVEEFIII